MPTSPTYSLSSAQAGIWFAQQMSGTAATYTTSQCLRLTGAPDVEALVEAIERTVMEAPTLTARAQMGADGPVQAFFEHIAPQVEVQDFRCVEQPRQYAQRWIDAQLDHGIELDTPRLYRFTVLRLSESEVWWLMVIHHLAADAFAYSLLQRRACEHYNALCTATDAPSPWFGEVTAMIKRDRTYQSSEACEADRAYWARQFADDPDPITLTERTHLAAERADRIEAWLGQDVIEALIDGADVQALHPAEVFVAAVGAYVCRWNQRDDVTLGLPMMGRYTGADMKTPITQVNVLPLRLTQARSDTPAMWAAHAREAMGGIRRHQRYRYEALQRDVMRRPGERALFGPQVNIMPFAQPTDWHALTSALDHLVAGPEHDISFYLHWDGVGRRAKLAVEANPNRYDRAVMTDHLDRLMRWAQTFSTHAERPVHELPWRLTREQTSLDDWNATAAPVESTDLASLFERQVLRTPEAPALISASGTLDYLTLNQDANRLAHLLSAYGVGAGDIVGVALERGALLEVALIATQKVGAAFMPLSSDYPKARLGYMIEQAGPRLIVSAEDTRSLLPEGITVEQLVIDAPDSQGALAAQPSDNPRRDARSPSALSYVLFTSGSTGKPKGVMIEQQAIVNRLEWMQAMYQLDEGDRVLQKTPSGFDVSIWEFFWPVLSGATLVMARPGGHKDPWYLLEAIKTHRITTLHFVPSMLQAFLDSAPVSECTSLRQVFCSGEALPKLLQTRLHDALPEVLLHNLYGPTEAAIDVSYWPCKAQDMRASLPIGRPIWNTQLHVLDDHGQPMPVGAAGELYIGGMNLARGYIGREDLTRERFIQHSELGRLYATGDLARWNQEGALEYMGRLDGQVKLRGQRIELDEINDVITRAPGVAQAAVSVISPRENDPRLVAYVVMDAGQSLDANAVRAWAASQLPSYMVPQHLCTLSALPLTDNGKLDRKALPMPELSDHEHYRAPDSEEERALCALFAEALDLERVGVDDNFFDLGGHSLTAVALSVRVRETLGWEITLATLFEAPSVSALASHYEKASGQDGLSVLLTLKAQTGDAPLVLCHPAGGLGWCYNALVRALPSFGPIYGLQARGLAVDEPLPLTLDAMAEDYLHQLKTVQPEGPYWLAGWSIGGMIAHTLAAKLQARGDEVRLLAMLDAYPSDQWRHLAPPDEQDALTALLRIAGLRLPESGATRQDVIELLSQEGHALASLPGRVLDAMVDVVANNSRLVRESHHQVYEGDVEFFTAAAPRDEDWLNRLAWRPYVRGDLINHDLPCDHPGMIQPEAARHIAARLEEVLSHERTPCL
ncbi:amino acid adenylation domain-containing protein [Larsenimonas salina]|uniref:amino acid adenylation domain-containing protein n=1 Tax=Larsenimonas salina TaxID=1295565 RepID=UPI0020744D22|nr:amino acid adenylation domain-containing protein [Larsenimonas salina]MCM5703931.1 amino acid adenylation domain-containing protein [Larsenimonas salina]